MPFLYSLFGVRPGEARLVGALLLHAVLLGTFRIFVDTAASTLFLIHFESTYLPYVYILVAVLVPLIGLLYQRLATRITFPRLIVGSFTALFLSLIVFRLWFALGDPRWSAFGFYVWSFAIAVLISLEFWGLAGQLLNVEQSKRLFNLISLGELFAIIPIGMAMPALTAYIRTPDMVLVANGAMLGMLALLVWFARTFNVELTAAQDAEADTAQRIAPDNGLLHIFKSRYIRSIMVLMCLFTLTFYLLDANFYTLLQKRYVTESEIAQFIGWYYALDSVLVLLANLVAGRFLSRFGIRSSLFILPGTLFIGGAAIVLASLWGAPLPLVFTLAFWTKLAESAVRYSLNGSATLVLYQPLPAKTRVQAQTAVEGIIEPITGGLAGVGLIVFERLLGFEPMLLALTMALFIVPWFGVALAIGRGYTVALLQALNKRQFGDNASPLLNDLTSAELLWQKLTDPHPNVVVYVLTLLEEMQHPRLSAALQQVLEHPAPEVRREALRRLERLGDITTRPAVRQRLMVEQDPDVRGAAVRALAVLEEPEPTDWAMPYLKDPEQAVRSGAVIGLLRSRGLSGIVLAGEQLLTWLRSSVVTDRVTAAQVLGEVGEREFDRHLLPLIHDSAPVVRRAALLAAGQLKSPRLRPLILAALTNHDAQVARLALLASGAAILPEIKTVLAQPDTPLTMRLQLVRLLGRIRDSGATDVLLTQLAIPDLSLRHQTLAALIRQGYRAPADQGASLHRLIKLEGQLTAHRLSARLDVTPAEADTRASTLALLQTALDEELRQSQARLFFLLALLYEPSAIQRVQDNLTHSARNQQAYALEALETLLRSEHRALVLAWLEPSTPLGRWQKLHVIFPTPLLGPVQRLHEIVQSGDHTAWARACALFALQDNAFGRSLAETFALASPPILNDTARWLLNRAPFGGQPMLSIIEKVLILKTISFFAPAPDQALAELAGLLVEVELVAGQRLFAKGDNGTSLYIIVSGRVRVHDGERLLNYLGERDIVGEMAVLDTEPRTADVTIETDALLLRLDQSALYELMADHMEVAQGIIRFLLQRMRMIIRESLGTRIHDAANWEMVNSSAPLRA